MHGDETYHRCVHEEIAAELEKRCVHQENKTEDK